MKFLSLNEFGIIAQVYMGVNVFSLFSYGFTTTANLEVPKFRIENKTEDLREVITSTFIMAYLFTLPIAGAYIALKYFQYGCTTQEWVTFISFFALLFLRQTQVCLTNIYLRGWKLFSQMSSAQWISYTLHYSVLIVVAMYFHFYYVLFALLTHRILFCIYVFFHIDFLSLKKVSKRMWSSMFKKSSPLFFNELVTTMESQANQIVITFGMSQVLAQKTMALYHNGLKVQEVLMRISSVTYAIFMVNLREFITEKKSKPLLLTEVNKYTQMLSAYVPWLCVCGIMTYQLVTMLLLDKEYEQSFIALKCLSWASAIMVTTIFYTIFLNAIEHLWVNSFSNIIATITMITFTFILIKEGKSISWVGFYTCIITAFHYAFVVIYSCLICKKGYYFCLVQSIRIFTPCIILAFAEYGLWKNYPVTADMNGISILMQQLFLMTIFSLIITFVFNRKGFFLGLEKFKLKYWKKKE